MSRGLTKQTTDRTTLSSLQMVRLGDAYKRIKSIYVPSLQMVRLGDATKGGKTKAIYKNSVASA